MAQDWYYKLLGEETGPVSFATLRELAQEGHLAVEDEVRTSASSWKLADQIPELFESGEAQEPELVTDMDLDLLLAPSSSQPVRMSAKRQAQIAAVAAASAPEAPVAEWYYKLLGQELGPVTADEIVQLIKGGTLQGADSICSGEQGVWSSLNEAPQFATTLAEMLPRSEWYYRILGQELGPITFEELQQLAKAGRVGADDEVRIGSDEPWTKARHRRGLKFARPVAVAADVTHDRTATLIPFGDAAKKREWYHEILGQEMGPISFKEMAKAFADGTLTHEDKARRGKTGAWIPVIDVPGLVSTDAKAAYLAAKQEANRPQPPAPPPVLAPRPVTALQKEEPRSAPAVVVPPPSAVTAPAMPPSSAFYGASGAGGGYGSMASSSRSALPPASAFKPARKSSGGASFGDMLSNLKDKVDTKALGAILVIMLAGLYFAFTQFGFKLSFGPPAGVPEYSQVNIMWSEIQQLHQKKAQPADWSAFNAEHENELKELLTSINKQNPSADRYLLQLMLFCVRDNIPKIISGENREERFKKMQGEMEAAAKEIGE